MEKGVIGRKFRCLIIFSLIIFINPFYKSFGQELVPLEVSKYKAVNLMFSDNVKYCDIGSINVAYTVTDNLVKITAEKEEFPETNLTVITEGNILYSFLLIYNSDPRKFNILVSEKSGKFIDGKVPENLSISVSTPSLPSEDVANKQILIDKNQNLSSASEPIGNMSEKEHNEICIKMIQQEKSIPIADVTRKVGLEIYNIYEYQGYHFISVYAYNESKDPFKVDITNFQQADKNGVFGKVYREGLKKPIYVFNEKEVFNVNGKHHIVYIFQKLKIEEGKKFLIEVGAADGRRLLSLEVPGKFINEAPVFEIAN